MREEEGWGEMRERKERIDPQRERDRERERERKTLGRKLMKLIKIYVCVCGRAKWFEEGDGFRERD